MFLTLLVIVTVLGNITQAVGPLISVTASDHAQYQGTQLQNGVSQWLGIGFAQVPLGEFRFRAPQIPACNESIKVADQHGLICLPTPKVNYTDTKHSEDCLYLDVYAPTAATPWEPLPVYVFIQGGGFATDANPNFNGTGLILASEMNIVIVTFNYRVGPYGFLASKEVLEDGDTNAGLKDQRFVFQWVQRNIRQFGGDPNRVTIGGDSAGAASVDLQLSAYGGRDDKLFHAAAAESQSFGAQFTVAESQYQYDALVERTGCNTTTDTMACLRSLSTDALQSQNILLPSPGGGGGNPLYMYSNVIDGDFTTDYTYNLYRQKKFIKVPTIWGDDTNGGTIFVPNNTANVSHMNTFLKNNFPSLTDFQLAKIDALYPVAPLSPLPNYIIAGPPATGLYWRATANAYGDMRYMCPGLYVASAYSTSFQRSWNYRFNVEDPDQVAKGQGVPHTTEVNAIWGPNYVTGTPPASYNTSLNANIVTIMQGYWISFIRAHDPNVYRAKGTPYWGQWDAFAMNRMRLETNTSAMELVDPGLRLRCSFFWEIGPSLHM